MIRAAAPRDLLPLVELGKVMHAESPRLGKLRFVPDKVLRTLAGLIGNPDGLLLVAEQDGEIIGGIAAAVEEHWFSDQKMAYDIGLFIHPAKRGTLAAPRLVEAYKAWAKSRDAVITQFGISTGVKLASTSRLIEHLGFKPSGFLFDAVEA